VGALLLAANERRFYALIVNASNTDIWIMFGSQNAVSQGIFVAANGFSYEIDKANLWRGEIYGIHGGGGAKTVSVFEAQ
jgi:hypothetical protein